MSSYSDSDPEMFPYNEDDDNGLNPFNYQDPLLTPAICAAVLTGKVEHVKELIEKGADVNISDNNANSPLHLAVENNVGAEIIDLLLSHSDIFLDRTNYNGYTPFLLGFYNENTDVHIMKKLLDAGCDVNATDQLEKSVLHHAVISRYPDWLLNEVIKKGADVNAQDYEHCTPLHRAAECVNVAAVYVLLYYDADVNMLCKHYMNPFMYAARHSFEISQILFDYYDDFSYTNRNGTNAFLLAADAKNPIALDIARTGLDLDCACSMNGRVLYLSLCFENAELFKEIWPRVNYKILFSGRIPFINIFISDCCFSTSEWLECMYLILKTPGLTELLLPTLKQLFAREDSVFWRLIQTFYKRSVPQNDRLTIIYTLLSYGAEACMNDILLTCNLYGIGEELEVLIRAGYHQKIDRATICPDPLLTFLLVLEGNCDSSVIFDTFCLQQKNHILHSLSFFSVPPEIKQTLLRLNQSLASEISEKFRVIPEIPTLLELSRNQARKYIRKTFKVEVPYQFYDAIKKLNIPNSIKDIIAFKKPLYV